MRYKRFKIKNFKGARMLELDLSREPRPNVFALVGLNESGKTTILEAIHWFYRPDSYDPHDLIPKSELANFNDEIRVTAEIELSEDDEHKVTEFLRKKRRFHLESPLGHISISKVYKYSSSTFSQSSGYWTIDIVGKTKRMKSVRTLNDESEHWHATVRFIEEELLPPVVYYENFLFDFPEKIYLEMKGEKEPRTEDVFYKEVIQDVLNSMAKGLDVDSHLIARYKSGKPYDRSSMESVLDKLGAKIETEVFAVWRELLKISGEGLSVTLGQTLEEDEDGYFIQLKVKEGDQTYFIRERSLGFRWFFSFVLLTHFRAYREKHWRSSLFLLDEPASNLHPTAQTKLLKAFERFPNDQNVIYATHSHHMINPRWLSGTFVVKNEAKEYAEVDVKYNSYMTSITAERYFQFVARYPSDTDYFRPILDSLDFRPSLLESTPELIVTEGKYDYYTLKYLQEMGFVSTARGDNLYPGTGKDKVEFLIGLYLGWGRNFVVLLDDDKGGRSTHRRLLDSFGRVIENRVFRLVSVSKGWKGRSMEQLFDNRDLAKVMNTIYPKQKRYDKVKFNVALQDCLINKRKVRLNAYTVKRFQKLFDFLDGKLTENRI